MSFFDRFRAGSPSGRSDPPAANDLERAVQAVRDGSGTFEAFLETLLRSPVFLLLKGDPPADPTTFDQTPLVVASSGGAPSVCVFTSPERSLDVQRAHPEYRTGLQVDFRWVLDGTPADLGIVLNPGSQLSLEQPADGVARLRADLASRPNGAGR